MSGPLRSADDFVRRRYPIIDAFDADPSVPLELEGFAVLDGSIECRRAQLEADLGAAIVVYAATHQIAAERGRQLCQRATAARLTSDELSRLRRFEATLRPGQVACAYRWAQR